MKGATTGALIGARFVPQGIVIGAAMVVSLVLSWMIN